MNLFKHAIVFFDLSGTLVEPDEPLSEQRIELLRKLHLQSYKIILVTGQPSNDPQVMNVFEPFTENLHTKFSAYTSRGGLRLEKKGRQLEIDSDYLITTRLTKELFMTLEPKIYEILQIMDLEPLKPVEQIDNVAIRISITPKMREEFVDALKEKLYNSGIDGIQVLSEGRTSVFVMKKGVNKRIAVEYELTKIQKDQKVMNSTLAYYFGNELAQGNDNVVLGVPGVVFYAIGPCGPITADVDCKTIGTTPNDLYDFLQAALGEKCE